jgi:hypothetical protein
MGSLRTESLYSRACVILPPQDGEGDRVAVEGLGPINKEESEDEVVNEKWERTPQPPPSAAPQNGEPKPTDFLTQTYAAFAKMT